MEEKLKLASRFCSDQLVVRGWKVAGSVGFESVTWKEPLCHQHHCGALKHGP